MNEDRRMAKEVRGRQEEKRKSDGEGKSSVLREHESRTSSGVCEDPRGEHCISSLVTEDVEKGGRRMSRLNR